MNLLYNYISFIKYIIDTWRIVTMADVVTAANEELYRRAFAHMQKHSMECIEETVTDMAIMFSKVCGAFDVPMDEVIKTITVEQFDYHLRKILDTKHCSCNNSI